MRTALVYLGIYAGSFLGGIVIHDAIRDASLPRVVVASALTCPWIGAAALATRRAA